MSEAYGKLPLHFEANRGQTQEEVRFLARGPGYSLYLTAGEAVFILARPKPDAKRDAATLVAVRMSLVGAAPTPRVRGLEELPGKANYFVGNDPARWRTNVPTYAKVLYTEVYPGIDLLYHGNQRQLEYDFIVAPGADPQKIVLDFQGAELEIDAQGDLVLHAAGGAIRQRKPVIYQEIDGVRTKIEGRYVLRDPHRVGFQVAAYDQSRPLVIDPTLVYSTYLGGSDQDAGFGIAVDAAGAAYVTGATTSADFTAGCAAPCMVWDATVNGVLDAFVTKLNPTGTALVYSTYLGGNDFDRGTGIAVDAAGAAYVTGVTRSTDFTAACTAPCTVLHATLSGVSDAFVTKLNAAGTALVYSTYLGGNGDESGNNIAVIFDVGPSIAVDAAGAAYVTGFTNSTDFTARCTAPCTVLDATLNGGDDAFVTKLNAAGTALVYSTYLGGNGRESSPLPAGSSIAVDAAGAAYVTGSTTSSDFTAGCTGPCTVLDSTLSGGSDAFVTKLNAAGTALVYSTYLGGSGDEEGRGVAVDAAGAAYVTGRTQSTDFTASCTAPCTVLDATLSGGQDAFVTKLNAAGTALVYSTYLGGNDFDEAFGIAVDGTGTAYVTGYTLSADFTAGCTAPCTVLNGSSGGLPDAFVTRLNAAGTALVYSTYLGGGSGADLGLGIAVDAAGAAYVTGQTLSADFTAGCTAPCTVLDGIFNGPGNPSPPATDAFVTKIGETCATVPGTWAATGAMSGGRTRHTATRLENGQVLIAGGLDTGTSLDNPLASALLYDPATGAFTPTGAMATARFDHTATLLPSGKVLVGGGVTTGSGGICINSAELFDPAANNGAGAFTSAGSMVEFRADSTATLLPNGKVLMTGGRCTGGASAELYDPAANSGAGGFVATGSMAAIRVAHTAALLPGGKVLVAGGANTIAGIWLASAEIFDPAGNGGAGAFSATGSMATARAAHQATALAGGGVLVTGGQDASLQALASAEIFDPATGSFTPTGAMTTTRIAHTATRLASGQVLIAGGLSASLAYLASAELFDQTAGGGTGAFTATLPMGTMRENHSATLLTNGTVLAVGGQDSAPTALASAEFYSPVVCAPFNTPVGSPVSVQPIDTTTGQTPVSVTFTNVTGAGQTLLTTSQTGPTPPPNFVLEAGLFYHVDSTATYSGTVTVCIDYSGTPLAGTTTQPVLAHFNSATGLWEMVTVTSWDPATNTICGEVTSLSPFALLRPVVVPFAAFRARLEIERHEFELKAAFTLGAASDGIAPLTEAVSLQVGSFSATVPAGSFKQHGKGRFKFEGVIDGTRLEVSITPRGGGRFELEAEAKRARLTRTVKPVAVSITIGNDRGNTAVRARTEERDDDARRR